MSKNHFWKIDGIIDEKLNASATFDYNGTASLIDGYLDDELISGAENHLVLLHRSNCGEDWEIMESAIINSDGNLLDKKGSILLHKLLKGEYVLGYLE